MNALAERVRQGRIEPDPFPHVLIEQLVEAPAARELTDTFPVDLLVPTQRRSGGDKTYGLAAHTIYDAARGGWSDGAALLPPAWSALCGAVVRPNYVAAVRGVLGVRQEVDLEVRFTEYGAGQGMSRHTDRPDKVFSQLLYLCPGWQPAWGGALALYATATAVSPAKLVVPGLGCSVLFGRSETSWHEVLPVTPTAPVRRRALLVHGHVRKSRS